MGPRREVIVAVAVASAAIACSSASSGNLDTAVNRSRPPTSDAVGSSGATTSSGSSRGVATEPLAPGCPSVRADDPSADLTEERLRQEAVGIYRQCGSRSGIELRVDPDADRLMLYALDERFVRIEASALDIESCTADVCRALLRLEGASDTSAPDAARSVVVKMWTSPLALELRDVGAFEGGTEWVRVAQ